MFLAVVFYIGRNIISYDILARRIVITYDV